MVEVLTITPAGVVLELHADGTYHAVFVVNNIGLGRVRLPTMLGGALMAVGDHLAFRRARMMQHAEQEKARCRTKMN